MRNWMLAAACVMSTLALGCSRAPPPPAQSALPAARIAAARIAAVPIAAARIAAARIAAARIAAVPIAAVPTASPRRLARPDYLKLTCPGGAD